LIEVPEEAETQLKIEREPAFEALQLPDLTLLDMVFNRQ